MNIRKNDTVYIRTGQDKGKTGRVLFVDLKKQRIIVEGINLVKRHQRPTQKQPKGGIVSKEASVHLSNVALYSSGLGGPTRISSAVITDGAKPRRVRICKKTGEQI